MKASSLNKLKLWLYPESSYLRHPNDESLFHDFLQDYVLNHRGSGSESDIRQAITQNANLDTESLETLIDKVLISYHAVCEFDKRQQRSKVELQF